MNIMYHCTFCGELYYWYRGIYENPKYSDHLRWRAEKYGEQYEEEPGIFISANAFRLYMIEPEDDSVNPITLDVKQTKSNLDMYCNLCPDCMRKLLDAMQDVDGESSWRMA